MPDEIKWPGLDGMAKRLSACFEKMTPMQHAEMAAKGVLLKYLMRHGIDTAARSEEIDKLSANIAHHAVYSWLSVLRSGVEKEFLNA